jgi:dihydroceramidase
MAVEVNLRPSLRKKYGTSPARDNAELMANSKERVEMARRDKNILKDMWWMIAVGLSVFLGGFGIWALDLMCCSAFRRWRHEIGLPWGILLEGHGWWLVAGSLSNADDDMWLTRLNNRHLMTGTGAYFDIVWGIWLRHCLNGRQDDFELSWPSIFSMPDIVPARHDLDSKDTKGSIQLNGHAKKRN